MNRPSHDADDDSQADVAVPPVKHLALKVVLSFIFVGLLATQLLLLPQIAQATADATPLYAHLRYPVLALSILWCVSPQVVVISTWRLADLVAQGHIFSDRPFWWVNAMAYSAFAGCVPLALMTGLLSFSTALRPIVFLSIVGAGTACLGVGLIVLVLRGLLRRAVLMRVELDEVI